MKNLTATTITTENNITKMTYHITVIAAWDRQKNDVTFCTGGWHTATTCKRINQFCEMFDLPFVAHRTFNKPKQAWRDLPYRTDDLQWKQTAINEQIFVNDAPLPKVDQMTFKIKER